MSTTTTPAVAGTPHHLRGTPVVPGLAVGPVVQVRTDVSAAAVAAYGDGGHADAEAALAAFDVSVTAVSDAFTRRAADVQGQASAVLTATAGLAKDRGLRGAVAKALGNGASLLDAIAEAVEGFVTLFESMGGLMAERATDLRDIQRRVVAHLVGEPEPGLALPAVPSVLVAEDLAPSDTAGLDPARVLALVTEKGGPTSHTAIIARQLGIPCVVGTKGALALVVGADVLVDGSTGLVELDVDVDAARARIAADADRIARIEAWEGPAATADGVPVKLMANVADGASARDAIAAPVEGVGLFRTELCFLDRAVEPSAEEQADIYAEVLEVFATAERADQHVVVRTLDAGSDKPVAFATHEGEENPALGVRGLRLAYENRGLMERQLDGIAAAAQRTGADAWVMAPMVATVTEAREFAAEVRERGLKPGVMIEVPSAALLADRMLEVVDFLSIGTNDLTQYTMAADRMASDLAHLTDPWQPAVLTLIQMTAAAGRRAGKPVGVCGEAAADPLLAVVLVGMGITSLSMAASAVRAVGARLAEVTEAQCREAAAVALAATSPRRAREAVHALLGA
ncbi:phosphoenolpyruvate--protein phosphotransferase [Nocardioides yefusunii]|uniref:Phosphoenolpyruvate-protein phosphotransferase n=1 Tax=Nocardioides yefusunii TaxID=2500546 RepID=A0ABW1QYB4_9ACTN|nr:phosphoenolpyruvate--protein phosphotransferase [Nocardioides yefusunii]